MTTIPGSANRQNHVPRLYLPAVAYSPKPWIPQPSVGNPEGKLFIVTPGTTGRELKLALFGCDEMGVPRVCKKDGV